MSIHEKTKEKHLSIFKNMRAGGWETPTFPSSISTHHHCMMKNQKKNNGETIYFPKNTQPVKNGLESSLPHAHCPVSFPYTSYCLVLL